MRAKYERAHKRKLEAEAVEREEQRKAEEALQQQKEEEAKAKEVEAGNDSGRWQKRTLGNNNNSAYDRDEQSPGNNDRDYRDGGERRGMGLRRGPSDNGRDYDNNYPGERRDDRNRRDYDRGEDRGFGRRDGFDADRRGGGLRRSGYGEYRDGDEAWRWVEEKRFWYE